MGDLRSSLRDDAKFIGDLNKINLAQNVSLQIHGVGRERFC
jgi:hypothetical protein